MKHFHILLLIVGLTFTCFLPHIAQAQDASTWMPDSNLRTAVRNSLGLAVGEALTQAGMLNLTDLRAARRGISNLTGLAYATNLTVARLAHNQISNLTPLSGLTSLTKLRLQDNNITSVTSLSGLTALTQLFLNSNQITDVSALSGLVNLQKLRLAGNTLTNAHVLGSLTNLDSIDITIPEPPDTVAPDVSISVPSGVQNGAFSVKITFTEVVSGFVQADVSLSGTATASITAWATTDNTTFTATITPTTSGTVTIGVAANVATDAASNQNTAATSQTVPVDTTAPGVSISVPSGVQYRAFSVTITFTEAVSGFVQADVSLSGTATASITAWTTTDNTTFTATITPTANGTVTIGVAANVATDAANNQNTAATSQTVTINLDTTAPGVSISVPSEVQNSAFFVTITFTEAVSGFTQSDVSLSGTTTASITAWTTTDNIVYTAMIIPASSGTVTIGVAANVATDVANNQNTAATSQTVTTNITVTTLSERTQQVQDAIVDAVKSADSIDDVTEADLAMIEQLSLRGESVTSLKSGDFSGLKRLNSLNLGVNDFTSLPSGIFDQLTDLRTLSIYDSSLTSLPSGVFDKNTKLTYINLVKNDLTSLPSGIFDKNTKLTILFLGNNDLTSLPLGIFDKLTALTTLDLRSNDLTDLPSEVFDKNTKLTQLYLHGNDLTSLPSGVFDELTELTLLYIYQNGLASLPSGVFDKNTKLADLKLKFNRIKDVSALENLTSLTILSIRANPISDYGPIRRLIAAIDAIPDHPGLTLDTPIPSAAPSAQPLPIQTELLANFPNPFNPETWIPYQLSKPADVSLTIYDMRGVVVREIKVGHQVTGTYRSRSRAIHWDGRNVFGEKVASGAYFYTLTAGDFSATRKLMIRK